MNNGLARISSPQLAHRRGASVGVHRDDSKTAYRLAEYEPVPNRTDDQNFMLVEIARKSGSMRRF